MIMDQRTTEKALPSTSQTTGSLWLSGKVRQIDKHLGIIILEETSYHILLSLNGQILGAMDSVPCGLQS